jgi:hypothetical protein
MHIIIETIHENENKNIFGNINFNNFVLHMRKKNYNLIIKDEYLEVTNDTSDIDFCYIEGVNNIENFCKNNDVLSDKIPHSFYSRSYKNIEAKLEYDIEFSKFEYTSEKIDNTRFVLTNTNKYKLVKELQYHINSTDYFSVLMIKDTKKNVYNTMKSSKITSNKYSYIYRIYIENIDNIEKYILELITAITLVQFPLTKSKQKGALSSYFYDIKDNIKTIPYIKSTETNPLLIMPKPITLEKINIISADENTYGVISIIKNYAVTEKADGERYLLYFDNVGDGYLINNTHNVQSVNFKININYSKTILDGELIQAKDGNSFIYAVFDIYLMNGKSVTHLPLIGDSETDDSRNKKMLEIKKEALNNTNNFEFLIKEQLYSDTKDIFELSKQKLDDMDSYPYNIDGLIFTPKYLPVLSYYSNKPVIFSNNMKWDRVFKWKPPDENTIDFVIKFVKDVQDNSINLNWYAEYDLYVGYNQDELEEKSLYQNIIDLYTTKIYNKNTHQNYILQKFLPNYNKTWIMHAEGKRENPVYTEENEIILNNSVVEFRYDLNHNINNDNKRWIPKRLREDKSRIYKYGEEGGTISKAANDISVAKSIWTSIHNPITSLMIKNTNMMNDMSKNQTFLQTDDIYYNRKMNRNNLLSLQMMNFHNICIKEMLYSKVGNKEKSYNYNLLEIGCGEGGDMSRWLSNNFTFIFGIDFVKKGIFNQHSGAYSRAKGAHSKRSHIKNRIPYMLFAVGDCSELINNGLAAGDDLESASIMKRVFGKNQKQTMIHELDNNINNIIQKGQNAFHVVSCMFAMHYFFKDIRSLDNFLTNVSNNLCDDGQFITTFMDGATIKDKLKNTNKIVGSTKLIEGDLPMWAIIKDYNDNNESKLGQQINVFIENTGRFFPEYLVDYNFFIQRAKDHQLELVESKMFKDSYENDFNQSKNKGHKVHKDCKDILREFDNISLQEFSFFNRWVVLKKTSIRK